MKSLEIKKSIALENYKTAKAEYLANTNNENWIKFCNAKKECMLLGVRI